MESQCEHTILDAFCREGDVFVAHQMSSIVVIRECRLFLCNCIEIVNREQHPVEMFNVNRHRADPFSLCQRKFSVQITTVTAHRIQNENQTVAALALHKSIESNYIELKKRSGDCFVVVRVVLVPCKWRRAFCCADEAKEKGAQKKAIDESIIALIK